ncbi:MAG TPA: hypothetical protein VE954_23195 [Oligoflexus sp.]|uniref:hypothetical protein n=1 Tax=Oligoflexus sp. TaxID=1971216 RepID=UPI002D52C990|nr:hypothetical protein [Oligoflexus sp.]HYX36018.1 hypothetical protein [Oligoflexus sp.]
MMGMDERLGTLIQGEAWLRQAVRRAVRTSKGSKRMVRWFGTSYLAQLDRAITEASVLELTGDLADSIERTLPGASLRTVVNQRNGEELEIAFTVGTQNLRIGV